MRVLQLKLEGFGPFSREHTIDFTEFTDTGVYLIGGPTGAGKSTILDAIVFALFGSVPRYEGVSAKRTNLRSDFAGSQTPTGVELTFATHESVYRVRRSPEYQRPKQRGDGLTPSKASVALDIAEGDGWSNLTTGYHDAGARIRDIVGLSAEQFQQTILLAQGRFAEFLQASSDERADILRRLFGTQRFGALTEAIGEEARASASRIERVHQDLAAGVERALSALGDLPAAHLPDAEWADAGSADADGAGTDGAADADDTAADAAAVDGVESTAPVSIDDALVAAQAAQLAADQRVGVDRVARDAAAAAFGEARTLLADIRERDAALDERSQLELRATDITEARQRLARAQWALELWQFATAKDEADRASAKSSAELNEAAQAAPAFAELEPEPLQTRVNELREEHARYRELVEVERSIPALKRDASSAERARTAAGEQLASLQERADALPSVVKTKQERVEALGATAAKLEICERNALDARDRVALHDRVNSAVDAHEATVAKLRDALAAKEAAADTANSALRAMLDGTAARLAQELRDGAPCPVCGASEHPAPANVAADAGHPPVTEEALEAARESERVATAACNAAVETERDAQARLSTLREQLGEADAATLAAALEQTETALRSAKSAAAELPEARVAVTEAERQLATLREQIDVAKTHVGECATNVALAHEKLENARERLAAVIPADSSASDEQSRVAQQVGLAESLLQARDRAITAEDRVRQSQTALQEALAGESEASLREAHLAGPEREALTAKIRDYDAHVTRVDAVLGRAAIVAIAERTAAGLPDLDTLTEAAETAERQHAESVGAAAAALNVIRTVERERDAAERLQDELRDMGERAVALTRLAQSLDGRGPNTQRMRLETYVLAAGLESILEAANLRLHVMTQGRYQLEHDDAGEDRGKRGGLGIVVRDDYTGQARTVQSLSGGETFLTSLALALGLADVVQAEAGGVQLDTLFIDEGFGALDAEVLELAMQTLADLQTGGRTIGVISHVPSMQERIPERVRVVRAAGGRGSTIEFP